MLEKLKKYWEYEKERDKLCQDQKVHLPNVTEK